jgi:hypothetical protein
MLSTSRRDLSPTGKEPNGSMNCGAACRAELIIEMFSKVGGLAQAGYRCMRREGPIVDLLPLYDRPPDGEGEHSTQTCRCMAVGITVSLVC